MIAKLAVILSLAACCQRALAAEAVARAPLPAGYKLLYEQSFDLPGAIKGFAFTDPKAWRIRQTSGNGVLELEKQSDYKPAVRSPVNIAMIADRLFGDFVLEASLLQTSKEYGHRDMCLFFGGKSPTQFYYAHMATAADDHAHNIFIVNEHPRLKIARETTKGVDWGTNQWHQIRLERRLAEGTIRLFYDDMAKPLMIAEDRTFGQGYIGFGSFDDTGLVDNVRIWGPASETKPIPYYKSAE